MGAGRAVCPHSAFEGSQRPCTFHPVEMNASPRQLAASVFASTTFSAQDLRELGFSRRGLQHAICDGLLVRVRRDRYLRAEHSEAVAAAARIGGRVTCLSLLQMLGIFVLTSPRTHVQLSRTSSRFDGVLARQFRVHWSRSATRKFLHVTTLEEAIVHAVSCQEPRAMLATLDSLLHHGLVTTDRLDAMFTRMPRRFQTLLRLVDASAESGPETFVRLMLRALGLSYETQVVIDGVGRVDFVVEGWLIIECDSKEFHEGWAKQQDDRHRDLGAAALGYVTIRPLAADVLRDPASVQQQISRIVTAFDGRFAHANRA